MRGLQRNTSLYPGIVSVTQDTNVLFLQGNQLKCIVSQTSYTVKHIRFIPFPGFIHFTLDTYLILLSVKQGGIKYHF